ncbi:MAG TPA: aminotransferase class V-fold PLP-dependent enzyme [Chthoniobacteraceae bacterium]|jgi:selenocysteine lyase/cysteine desulfurase|nr:aminotransferase class V-fold PLP-dependent enzyme [Chthoniobacteraceae bacterium]
MTDPIASLVLDEAARREAFPVCRKEIFMSHAAVTVLPRVVGEAMIEYTRRCCEQNQEFAEVLLKIGEARKVSADFIGAQKEEIALLGPTSLGLSLFANGLPWNEGDELLCYADDYPANVYPWMELARRGVKVKYLSPERPGEITPGLVEASLTERTRLVALASCNFLSGYRIDVDAIGRLLRGRGVLFSLDAIQSIGATPLGVEHVDFLSADAHKWILGPMAIGIVFVRKEHFELLRPTLLGAWNVRSPNFIAQPGIEFLSTAQRYEPGVLNTCGIYGMRAALDLLASVGIERIYERLLHLKRAAVEPLRAAGFEFLGPTEGPAASGITTFHHPARATADLFKALEQAGIVATLRYDRAAREYIRLSPHCDNTLDEMGRVVEVLTAGL